MAIVLYIYLALVCAAFALATIGDYEGDELGALGFVRDLILNIPLLGKLLKAVLIFRKVSREECGVIMLRNGYMTHADVRCAGNYLEVGIEAYGTCLWFWFDQLNKFAFCVLVGPVGFLIAGYMTCSALYVRQFQWSPPPFSSR